MLKSIYSHLYWNVFLPGCDPCVHGLLDTTDQLQAMIDPVMEEMKDVSLSYFANKRLQNVNRTADTLRVQ